MAVDENNIDDILIPQRKRRRRHIVKHKHHNKRSGRGFMKFLMCMFLVLAVLGVIFSFADIGGSIILGFAEKYLKDNYSLTLTAESITGNPVKGYTLNNFSINDSNDKQIISAEYLSGRVNFPALFTGRVRLAEISIAGVSTDIEQLISSLQTLSPPTASIPEGTRIILTASPAFADNSNTIPDIPVDRFTLKDSHFTSQYGVIDVNEIGADLSNFDVDIDASINGLPLKGIADMGEAAGLTAVNRAELTLGTAKITATGGLINDKLDLHSSIEKLDLKEITALYPELLKADDFDGIADLTADIIGNTDDPRFAGTINYKGSKIYGFPVERVSANLNYSDNRLSVSNIQASAFNVPVQGETAIANRPNEPVSIMIKLDGSEANLEGLDKILKLPELKGLTGKVSSFNANISGPVNSLSGLVNFNAPKISYGGKSMTNIRAQMKLAKSDTAHVDGKFNFEGSQGYLNGNVASVLINPKLDLTAKIVDLDIKRVENMIPDASDYKLAGKITASVSVKGSTSNPSVSGSLNSPEFSGWGQKITKPVVNFSFANKNLTLSKTEGTLNGMPINLSGTIGPLPSENPSLNINATITMSPSSLKAYVPDISQYDLKGNINAGLKINGSVNSPSVRLLASSPNIQAMKMITAKDLELTTALDGDLTKLDRLSLNIAANSITASGVTFSGVNAKLDKNGDKIILGGLNAKSGSGTITGAGTASVSGKSPLDFSFRFTNLALGPLASASGVDMKGNLSGTLRVAGSNTNPSITMNANVPALNAMGFALNNFLADLSGNMQNIKLNKVRADVEGAELTATGTVQIAPALKLNISLNGNNIKLERLLSDYPEISGTAGLTFNLTGNDKNITGKGTLTSSGIKAYGLKLTNINLPLSYSGNNFNSSNGTAKLYGGSLKNTLTFDINAMKFTDNIEASGVDVNSLIQDVSGGLEGKITGTGKLTMKINGTAKDKVSYNGSGNFSMGSGAITGFKWLDVVSKIHGTNGIKYTSITAPLTLQTGKLLLRAGSIVNANNNDPMYKYAKLTQNGIIDFSGKETTMTLNTESSINYQLINAIQGGSKGGLEALFKGGVSNFQDGLKAFLSGGFKKAKETASTGDFRTVTLKISGKAASPSFSALKIGPSTLKAQNQTQQSQDKTQITKDDLKEKLIDRAVDVVLPDKIKNQLKKPNTTNTAAPKVVTPSTTKTQTQPVQTQQQKTQNTRQKLEDKVKEEVKKGLQKGLGGLFKR